VLFLAAALTLNFQSLVALSCALVLSASNVYGYYMCSADQRRRWSEWMSAGANVGVMTSAMRNSKSLGWLFGRGGGTAEGPAGGSEYDDGYLRVTVVGSRFIQVEDFWAPAVPL